MYFIIKKLKLTRLVNAFFTKNKQRILNNLTSRNPNLYLLDFYKLGHLSTFKPSKNVDELK